MSPGIRGSSGGSCDPLNFYCTNYNTSYGHPDFSAASILQSGTHSHRGTGYQSNFRPAVYYSPNLDRKDNPQLGLILRNNYSSITSRDFTPHQHVTGAESLPHQLYSPQSGYIRSSEVTNPKSRTVKSVHFDTRDHGSKVIPGILPKHRPLLLASQGKGSPDMENLQHGPSFMSTEYKTRFTPKATHHPGKSQTIGEMENSGFTEGSNLEPITYDPYSPYRVPSVESYDNIPHPSTAANDCKIVEIISKIAQPLAKADGKGIAFLLQKGYHRFMGHSITKTDFLPTSILQGKEPLPALARNSDRDSGFSRELDQVLRTNAPFINFRSDDKDKNKDNLLGRTSVGKKEESGFSNNNLTYVQSGKEPPQQYLTNYNLRFYNPVAHGRDREGWTRGGIQKQLHSGFSVNNEGHIPGI